MDCSVLVQNTGLTALKGISLQLKTGTGQAAGKDVAGTAFTVAKLAGNDSILQHVTFQKPADWTPSQQPAMFAEAASGTHKAFSQAKEVSAQSFNTSFLTTATIADQSQIAVSGDTVAFSDNVLTNGGDIYLYDLVTRQRTQVTQDGYSRDVDVDGGNVVYVSTLDGQYTVELYSLSNQQTTAISAGAREKRYPKISGNSIVWQDARSGVSQIYAYNLQTKAEVHLKTTTTNQTFPDIDGDSIVWVENGQVWLHDIATDPSTQVTTDGSVKIMPHVSGSNIVWVQWGGGLNNAGTYAYNIPAATISALSLAGTTTSFSPVISGNRIVRTVAQESNVLDFVMDDLGNDAAYGTCDDLANVALTTDHSITNQAWPVMDGYNLIYLGSNGLYRMNTNSPPVINQNAEQTANVGQAISLSITAADQDIRTCNSQTQPVTPHLNYTAQYLPAGAQLTDNGDNTATFTWTPSAGQEGVYDPMTFTVTDDDGLASSENVKMTVRGPNQPPVFVPIAEKTVYTDEPLAFAVAASDPEGDPLTYGAEQLPAGAQLSNSIFSWTPSASQTGDHTVVFTVTDGKNTSTTQVTITVLAQPAGDVNAPVVADPGAQTVKEGQIVSVPVTATDPNGTAPALTAANLPYGALFTDNGNGRGTFSWTPTYDQAGQYTVTFFASNGTLAGWKTILITVGGINRAPVLDPVGNKTVIAGQSLIFTLVGRDPDSDLITYSVKSAPVGSMLTGQTFSWAPTSEQAGTYSVVFSVTDGSLTASETITITVQRAVQVKPPTPVAGGDFSSQPFTAFTKAARSGYSIASGKVWKNADDPRAAVIVGAAQGMQPQVKIYTSDGRLKKSFYAYEKTFLGGVRVAACDLNGDGVDEILTAPGPGYRPYIREFDATGRQVLWKQIWALDGKTKNGLNIACGDLNGDGKAEIIAASDIGSGHMTIHKGKGSRIGNTWPFGHAWRGGIVLSAIDTRGTDRVDIAAATQTGAAQIRLLNDRGKRIGPTILPYAAGTKNGVFLSAGDVDGDQVGELVLSQLNDATSRVRVYSQSGIKLQSNFLAYPKTVAGGVRTAVGDVEASGGPRAIIAVPAQKMPAQLRFFDASGAPL